MTIQAAVIQSGGSFQNRFDPIRFSRPRVVLDLAVFADGGFIGPGRAATISLEKAKFDAETQMLAMIEDSGISDVALTEMLTNVYNSRRSPGAADIPGLRIYQGAVAKGLLDAIQKQGRTGWFKRVRPNRLLATTFHRLE